MKTIISSVLIAFLGLLLYQYSIGQMNISWKTTQYDFQENLAKSQSYLLESSLPDTILIGSSLSARLNFVNTRILNLAMPGAGIFDGLALVDQHDQKPICILVEINLIERNANKKLTEAIDKKEPLFLKRTFPALREENQPVGIIIGKLENRFFPISGEGVRKGEIPENIVNNLIETNTNFHTENIIQNLSLLDSWIRKNDNIELIFFEMPQHDKICDLPKPIFLRSLFSKYAVENDHGGILEPICEDYFTTDGKHLGPDSSKKYVKFLLSQINGS